MVTFNAAVKSVVVANRTHIAFDPQSQSSLAFRMNAMSLSLTLLAGLPTF